MPELAYVNGWVGPLVEARVSVLDRGFLFADGVYEVLRTYDGKPFELRAHLRRLQQSLRGLQLGSPLPPARLQALVLDLVRQSGLAEARVYIQVTRGSAPRRQPLFPPGVPPTLVIYVESAPAPAPWQQRRGVRVITLPDWRWKRCDLKTILGRDDNPLHRVQVANFFFQLQMVDQGLVRLFMYSGLKTAKIDRHPVGLLMIKGFENPFPDGWHDAWISFPG